MSLQPPRPLCRIAIRGLALAGLLLTLGGCRLYEPPRYERLHFAPDAPATRVLMIGNSLTYYNDLPGLLQQMSIHESAPVYIEKITSPYASLKVHWAFGAARKRVAEGVDGKKWDVLVLQEFSRKPVTNPEETADYFRRFSDEAKRAGVGKVLLFENWTRRGKDDDYASLESTYRQIARETGATIAPIGAAWRALERQHPDIHLFLDDRHPTDAGTYLAAAVLYDIIYGKKSAALPQNLQGPKIPPSVEAVLRQTADDAVAVASP
jgi:hypothetical protein